MRIFHPPRIFSPLCIRITQLKLEHMMIYGISQQEWPLLYQGLPLRSMFVDINLYHGAATVPLKSIRFTAPANPVF